MDHNIRLAAIDIDGTFVRSDYTYDTERFHRLKWTDDFRKVKDQILKFTVGVPEEKTQYYFELIRERLKGIAEPTTSGHGSIDVILPGCHTAGSFL